MKLWGSALMALYFFAFTSPLAGCKSAGAYPSAPHGSTARRLTVTSSSFPANGTIPVDYTCDGADRSPELTWSAVPERTRSLVLLMDDPDAPSGAFTHWVAYNLKADALEFPEAGDPAAMGGSSGTNDANRVGYGGPCPPRMELHHYAFRVFALDTRLPEDAGATRAAIDSALSGHVLAEGVLVGTFSH